jgi:Na+/proline symporter
MVDVGALFTEGLYRPHLAPHRSDRHYLWVGRVSGVAITMIGVLYAMFLIQSVLYTFLLTETLATFVGISLVGGLVWPRANRWGALASLVCALGTNFLLYYLAGQRLDRWDPNVFLAALVAGIVALVVVSLLTSPEPADRVVPFFERLQTSSDPPSADAASVATVAARPLLLVSILRLRSVAGGRGWRAFAEDLGGLAIGCALVAALVGATALLLGM